MGNYNTYPAPSERLEAYYTGRRTSEIDTKGNKMFFSLSRLLACLVDVVGIYIKINKEKNKTNQKASISFTARFDELYHHILPCQRSLLVPCSIGR